MRAQLHEAGEEVPEQTQTFTLGLLPGPADRYVVTEGPAKGMKGYFARDASGAVDRVHVGGRLATRVAGPKAGAGAAALAGFSFLGADFASAMFVRD